ncbi:hypothetical protein DL93DRAFT_2082228 [Clavulina sp. PMI_390]|nr:hypothetical protein DL93DRAFT_2082228 [Clavulina sp. PMI_390]
MLLPQPPAEIAPESVQADQDGRALPCPQLQSITLKNVGEEGLETLQLVLKELLECYQQVNIQHLELEAPKNRVLWDELELLFPGRIVGGE